MRTGFLSFPGSRLQACIHERSTDLKDLFKYLIPILIQLESEGNPSAIGDKGDSVGILQISTAVVMDVNMIVRRTNYDLKDRLDPIKSREMCEIYLTHWGSRAFRGTNGAQISLTDCQKINILARIWNGGPKGFWKQSTVTYGTKATELYRSIQDAKKLAKIYDSISLGYDDSGSPHPYDFGVQAGLCK